MQSRIAAVGCSPGMRVMASATAMKPPVMAAVRVPPSAWITSQSTHTVRSPSLLRSMTARSARPAGRGLASARPRERRRPAGRPRALVPGALVLGEAGEDRARDLVAVLHVLEAPLLAGVGDEADLDQDCRHRRAAEDVEARLLDAPVGDAKRLGHRIVDHLG